MLLAQMDHDLNVVGALVVALGDRMRDATEDAAAMSGALPAALAALHEWAGGRTVDTLAGGLRLSHSRTVRVVDRLEAAGLAARERDPADGRGVLVGSRPRAAAAAERVARRARAALDAALAGLGAGERAGARRAGRALLAESTDRPPRRRGELPAVRRDACGHDEGRCPVTRAADAAEPASGAHRAAVRRRRLSPAAAARSPSSSHTSGSRS